MAYPEDFLDVQGDIYLGAWTPMTSYMLVRDPITVDRGRPDESSQLNPTEVSFTADNRDGRWSVRNPAGAWYGLLRQNTPMRLSVPASVAGQGTYLRLENDQVSYASTASLSITGSIDVRVDMEPSSWYSSILAQIRTTTGLGYTWLFQTGNDGTLQFLFVDSGSIYRGITSGIPVALPPAPGRIAVRVTFNAGTGAVTFYTAPSMSGTWTQLAAVSTTATSILAPSAGAVLCCGGQSSGGAPNASTALNGAVYEMQVYNGIGGSGGTLAADPVFSSQSAGALSFTDAQSNTWVLAGTAEISDRLYRAHAELAALPKSADPSQRDITSSITAYGLMHRLQEGSTPVASALRRYYTALPASAGLAAYWPCEDPQGSTSIAAGIPGVQPMAFTGTPSFQGTVGSPEADQVFACSASLPQVGASAWTFVVPQGTVTWTDNVVRFNLYETAGSIPNGTVLVTAYTTGTVAQLVMEYGSAAGGSLSLTGFNSAGTQLFNATYALLIDNSPCRISFDLIPSGAGVIQWQIEVLALEAGQVALGRSTYTAVNGTISGSVGAVTVGGVNPAAAALNDVEIGHFSVAGTWDSMNSDLTDPLNAWSGEPAGMRVARLCAEEGLQYRVAGFPDQSQAMGAQAIDTFANLLQDIEQTDLGMLFEPRQCLGVGYVTSAALTNQSPDVTADYSLRQVSAGFGSTADDLIAVNDVIVSNYDGQAVEAILESGAMSVQDPPDGMGQISTSPDSYAAAQDVSQVADLAYWLLHVRSVDEDRYPGIPFQLARPDAQAAVALLDIGSYLQIINTPGWVPPPPVKQLVAGTKEQLGPARNWTITVNAVPESPYEVMVAGTDATDSSHEDTTGTVLAEPVSDSATSLELTGDQWTTDGADFPFDIMAGGERMTVNDIAYSLAGNTLVGVFLNPAAMGLGSWAAAQSLWTTWTGQAAQVTRVYLGNSTDWSISSDMSAMIAAGVKMLISVQPAYSPVSASDLAALTAFVADLVAAGAICDFTIYHEPYYTGLTAAQYQAAVAYYGPVIRQSYPLAFVSSVSSVANNNENSYFPGTPDKPLVDLVASDYYAAHYVAGETLDLAASVANNCTPPLPFGCWEIGGSLASTGQTATQISNFVSYVSSWFVTRGVTDGLPGADICWFNGAPGANFFGCGTTQAAGFEGGIGNWTAAGNSTIADSSAQAHSGSDSLAMTAQANGSQIQAASCAVANLATQGMAVAAGDIVDLATWLRGATTAKAGQIGIGFYASGLTQVGSGTYGSNVTDSDTAWTAQPVLRGVTVPSGAVWARGLVQVDATVTAGEVHYSDDVEMRIVSGSNAINSTTICFGWDSRLGYWGSLFTALNDTASPQVMAVTRSVNGVVKAHSAGDRVTLAQLPIAALS